MDFLAKKYILKVSFNIAKYPFYYDIYNVIYYLSAIRLHCSSLVSELSDQVLCSTEY